jgi:hypothetical protein
MQWLTRSDIILLAIASYVAIMSLVRLMQHRRDELVSDVKRQVDAHRTRLKRPSTGEQSDRNAA